MKDQKYTDLIAESNSGSKDDEGGFLFCTGKISNYFIASRHHKVLPSPVYISKNVLCKQPTLSYIIAMDKIFKEITGDSITDEITEKISIG